LSGLGTRRPDLQRDSCPFVDRLEVREAASIIKTSAGEHIQPGVCSEFLGLVATLDREPKMEDALASRFQKPSLRRITVSRLAKLQLGVVEIRELVAHLQKGRTIVAVQLVRIHGREISPWTDPNRLVILHSVFDIADHDADVVQFLKNRQLVHRELHPWSVLTLGRRSFRGYRGPI
jgi:hypothetical protein